MRSSLLQCLFLLNFGSFWLKSFHLKPRKYVDKIKLPVTGSSFYISFALITDSIPPQLILNSTHKLKKNEDLFMKYYCNWIVWTWRELPKTCRKWFENFFDLNFIKIVAPTKDWKRFTYALTRGFARSGKISATGKCAWKWRVKIKLIISISIKLFLIQLETTFIMFFSWKMRRKCMNFKRCLQWNVFEKT